MNNYSQAAFSLKLALDAGLIETKAVINWADDILCKLETYDNDVANVSMAFNASERELSELLERIPGPKDEWSALREILPAMHEALLKEPSRALGFATFLNEFQLDRIQTTPPDMEFIFVLLDGFEFNEVLGLGTPEEATQYLLEELQAFRRN